MQQISYDILTNALNISEKYAQPERQIKCHDRRPFSATPASGARRSGGCPGRTCPRAHLSAPPPASNSESGLPVPVLHQRPASGDRSNRQFRPISLRKKSEERFEGFSLQNWIEKGKLKNRKHSNMFLLRCKAGIMVFGILRA